MKTKQNAMRVPVGLLKNQANDGSSFLVHVLEGNCALLKLDNDVLVETVPSTTPLGDEHRRLGKAKSQVGEQAGHRSISHQSDVRGICSSAATGGSEALKLPG